MIGSSLDLIQVTGVLKRFNGRTRSLRSILFHKREGYYGSRLEGTLSSCEFIPAQFGESRGRHRSTNYKPTIIPCLACAEPSKGNNFVIRRRMPQVGPCSRGELHCHPTDQTLEISLVYKTNGIFAEDNCPSLLLRFAIVPTNLITRAVPSARGPGRARP